MENFVANANEQQLDRAAELINIKKFLSTANPEELDAVKKMVTTPHKETIDLKKKLGELYKHLEKLEWYENRFIITKYRRMLFMKCSNCGEEGHSKPFCGYYQEYYNVLLPKDTRNKINKVKYYLKQGYNYMVGGIPVKALGK